MSQTATLFGRLGSVFRRRDVVHREIVPGEIVPVDTETDSARIWRRHEPSANPSQSLADLMNGIRDSLESSSRRQDEMLELLREIPATLQQLPQTNLLHAQAVESLSEQVRQQNQNHSQMTLVLQSLASGQRDGQQALLMLGERIESMRMGDVELIDSIKSVAASMSQLSSSSIANLESSNAMRESIQVRERQINQVVQSRNGWIAGLVAVSVIMSVMTCVGMLLIFVLK